MGPIWLTGEGEIKRNEGGEEPIDRRGKGVVITLIRSTKRRM